jgi:hypothetical protein
MSNQIIASNSIETAIINGDLSKLTPEQRVNHYLAVCKSTGLNPLTKPFDYINLSGKLVLYAKKDCTDQLRKNNHVSIVKLERETISGVYVVTAYAEDNQGRSDSSIGAVNIESLKGDTLANAMMKAETKAKRRVTLSICGLGWLDETEIETIHGAQKVVVNETGEIVGSQPVTEPVTMTLDEAMDMRTAKGAQFGELNDEQLQFIIDKSSDPLKRQAAQLILNSFNPAAEEQKAEA